LRINFAFQAFKKTQVDCWAQAAVILYMGQFYSVLLDEKDDGI